MRLRSIVRVHSGEVLDSVLESDADAVLLGLTDESQPIEDLRASTNEAVGRIAEAGKNALVVVNHPRTQLTRGDLDTVTDAKLDAVLLPHCTEPQDVRDTAVLLREFEQARGIEPGQIALFPIVDTARGLLCGSESLAAAPRTAGLVLSSEAFARDVGARFEESGPRLAFARGNVVTAAAAHEGVALIDGSSLALRDMANYGFSGAILDDVRLATLANDVFAPNATVLKHARADLEAYKSRAEGDWVTRRNGMVVDAPRARQALRAVQRSSDAS